MIAINRESIERAVEKAKRTRTKVRMLSFRRYEVTNPQGVKYAVTFELRNGRKLASCTCKARVICYHIAGCLQAHLIIARMRAEAEKASKPEPTKEERRAEEEAAILIKNPPTGERLNGFDI